MQKRDRKIENRKVRLVTAPDTPFSYREAFKVLRTNVKFLVKANNAKSFVITSALPEESKSNVAINLSITLAEEGARVLLIDGDFRKPMLHKYLGIKNGQKGLTNAVLKECKLTEVVHHLSEYKIDLLPAGTIPPNPSELLASQKMQVFVEALKNAYDYVIFDAPPVSVVTDAAVIGSMVDGAFLVIRSDFAPLETVHLAKKRLEDVNVNIFGSILTRYKNQNQRKYGYYSYGYYR